MIKLYNLTEKTSYLLNKKTKMKNIIEGIKGLINKIPMPIRDTIRRFVRVFISSFLASSYGFVEVFGGWSVIREAFLISFGNGMAILKATLVIPLLIAGIAGAFTGFFKYLRIVYPDNKLLKNLPF